LRSWFKFFAWQLPLALIVIELGVELVGFGLSGVTLHRHNVDDLAYSVAHDRHPYKVVLLGDSITHNVAHKYRIGDVDEVADLTTHAFAGLPSSLFLLKRYLESGHRPSHVVIAASRDVFTQPIDKGNFDYYVATTFTRPYEREFLGKYYPGYVDYRWKPAALSVTTKVGEPLFSLLRHPGDQIWIGPDLPSKSPVLDQFPNDRIDQAVVDQKIAQQLSLTPEAREILMRMCSLSRQYGFKLHVIFAPLPPSVHATLAQQGKLTALNNSVKQVFEAAGADVTLDDASDQESYLSFDRDLIHIKGLGWEQKFAVQLADYIHGYDDGSSGRFDGEDLARPNVSTHAIQSISMMSR